MPTNKESFPVYMDAEKKQALQEEARSDGRSLNNYVTYILDRRDEIATVRDIQKRHAEKK